MPLGNPIRKQNESRMVSVLATEGQTVFTVQGGYIINHISVFRNGVRLSPAEDFTAGDGSTVTLNNAANIDDRIDFHIFDRFTVQNAIVGAASSQTISGDLVINGKVFGNLQVSNVNTGIVTATELDLNGKAIIGTGVTIDQNNFEVAGISTFLSTVNFKSHPFIREGYALRLENGFKDEFSQILNSGASDNANIVFQTGSGGTLSEAMRIDPSGRLLTGGAVTAQGSTNADDLQIGANNQGNQTGITLGSASASSVRFSDAAQDSAGMIFYDHATNHLGLYANNSERLRIFSNGGVNIGAASSTSGLSPILHLHKNASNDTAYLHITSNDTGITASDGLLLGINASGDALVFNKDSTPLRFATANSERMRIDSSGRVLIGHNSSLLIGGGDSSPLQVSSTTALVFGGVRYVNSSSGPFISLSKSRAASAGSNTIVQDSDDLGTILFSGDDGTDLISKGAQIQGQVDGSPGANDMPGRLVFSTTPDGSHAPVERMRIKSDGKVGVNITSPRSLFDLGVGTDNASLSNTAADYQLGLHAAQSATGDIGRNIAFISETQGTVCAAINSVDDGTSDKTALQFVTGNSTSISERMRITTDGNIGIGNDGSFPIYTGTNDRNFILGTGSDDVAIQLHSGTDKFGGLYFGDTTSGGDRYIGYVEYKHDDNYLRIATNGTERVRIKSDGKFGINTNSPAEMLHVNGTTQSTDYKYTSHPGHSAFTGNNSTTAFTIQSGHSVNSILVVYNGVVLTPTTDYTVSGTTLTTTFTPLTNAELVVRYLVK